jgi:O-antigen/teichoic acid export membrane protein
VKAKDLLTAALVPAGVRIRDELRSEITQDSLVVLSGHFGRLILGLASSALLARGLGPEGLSVFFVVGAALAIAVTVADFGLGNSGVRHIAVSLAESPQRAREVAVAYTRLKLLSSLLAAGLIVALARPIAHALNLPHDSGPAFIRIAALSLLAMALSGISGTILRALRRFGAMVATQLMNAALTVVLMASLFFLGRLTVLPALLVGGITAAAAAGLGLLLLPTEWRAAIIDWVGPRRDPSRRLLAFSKWLWISAIVSILSAQLDLLLLNRWSEPRIVGYYALALSLAFKADIINQTLHTVLLPSVSSLSTRAEYVAYVRGSLSRSVILGLALVLALPLARPFILTIYGSAFAPSVNVFYLLMAVVLVDLLTTPILLLAFPLNMPRLIAMSGGVGLAVLLGTAVFSIPNWGMYGAVAAKLAGKVGAATFLGLAILMRLRESSGISVDGTQPQDAGSAPDRPPPGTT